MIIKLHGNPKSDIIVKIGDGCVLVSYDRKGCLRLIREAKRGLNPLHKTKKEETVFWVTNFNEGKAIFKSSESHCGFFSAKGQVYWSTIFEDAGPSAYKKCSFQDWVNECAQVLAGI